MRIGLRIIVLLCISLHTAAAYAAGTASGNFLKLGIGARNAAMGDTGATDASANAVYWNPAGLNRAQGNELAFMHASWLDGITFQNITYKRSMEAAAIGVAATYLSVPSIDKYDNTGLRQGDSYKPSDMAVSLAYARTFKDIPAGLSLKYISSTIDDKTATAVAADVGVNLEKLVFGDNQKFLLGLSVLNIGTAMKYNKESFGLPLTGKVGIAYLPVEAITLALDINQSVDADAAVMAGGEYRYTFSGGNAVAGRLGARTNTKGLGGLAGISAGVGVLFAGLGFDYAFVPYGDVDDTHRISLSYAF